MKQGDGSCFLMHSVSLYLFFFIAGFLYATALATLELTFVDQADLELRDLPASASRVLGLKACATIA